MQKYFSVYAEIFFRMYKDSTLCGKGKNFDASARNRLALKRDGRSSAFGIFRRTCSDALSSSKFAVLKEIP